MRRRKLRRWRIPVFPTGCCKNTTAALQSKRTCYRTPMGPTNQTFLPLGEALVHAERCRNEGRLAEAEAVCRRVLEADPNVAEAENLLGVIAHQNGRLGEAIAHVERATELAPQVALFHANLGEMYRLSGSPKLAVKE